MRIPYGDSVTAVRGVNLYEPIRTVRQATLVYPSPFIKSNILSETFSSKSESAIEQYPRMKN